MKACFDIHGVPLEISADHPLLFETFREDLRHFERRRRPFPKKPIRLALTALPDSLDGNHFPKRFFPYREMGSQRIIASGETVTCYARSALAVISSLRKRSIQAAVRPEMALLADPAYHYCFTQPANVWFKRRGLFFLHAGCVSKDSQGILITGHSRAGKSVLSLSAVRGGFKFLSDEQPLLSFRNGKVRAHSFPRRIRLHRADAGLFPELGPLLRSSPMERLIFPIQEVWRGCIASSCKPRVLIFPEFHKRGSLRVSRLHPSEALARLLQDDHFIWYKMWTRLSNQHLSLFAQLVKQAAAFRMEYGSGDLGRIPALFGRLLKDG